MATGGINGVAVATAATGGFLLWTGIRNVTIADGLRDITRGRIPTEGPQVRLTGSGSGYIPPGSVAAGAGPLGQRIVDAARAQLGKRYVFGTEGPDTFDCSGLVYWALNHAGVRAPRLTAAGYLIWSGATSIGRDQIAPGDLVCWAGHIGIAAGGDRMIEAPNHRVPVRDGLIWTAPVPVIRRVKTPAVVAQSRRT